MPRGRSQNPPKYRHHKARNLAVVTIDGTDRYLGSFGSSESYEKYAQLIAGWRRRASPPLPAVSANSQRAAITIAELTLAYWEFAQEYYSRNGRPNGRTAVVRSALRAANGLYADFAAFEFGPLKLQAIRQTLIDRQLSRHYVNDLVATLVGMFQWAVAQELIPVEVYTSLKTVRGLRKGKTTAKDNAPVPLVDETIVTETLEHLPAVIRAMVELQLASAARPGEIRTMRPCDITIGMDGPWCYRPSHHKTEHHNKDRRIFLGPRAQDVLRPFLDRPSDAYCFSPRESEEARRQSMRQARKSKVQPSQKNRRQRNPDRVPGELYTKDSYCRAICRACKKAGVPVWTPHQLRHTAATRIRQKFGLESAQVILGHSDANVTEIYAERDYAKAAQIMKEIG